MNAQVAFHGISRQCYLKSDREWIERVTRVVFEKFEELRLLEFERAGDPRPLRVDVFLSYYADKIATSVRVGVQFGRVTKRSQDIRVTVHYVAQSFQNTSEQELSVKLASDIESISRWLQLSS